MKHRSLTCVACLALALWLSGCETLSLAVDPAAMEQELAMRVESTLTAIAPTATATPTETPIPTLTPVPTDTPRPTLTPTPKPTNTRRPTATAIPTPTTIPVQVPEDWVPYEGFTDVFSVYHPANWSVESEGGYDVTLLSRAKTSSVTLFIAPASCDLTGDDTERASRCVAELAGEFAAWFYMSNKYISQDVWSQGGLEGYVVEQVMTTKGTPIYTIMVCIPLTDEAMMTAICLRSGTRTLRESDCEIMTAIVGSFRLNGELEPSELMDWEEAMPL
ncbi:MAG: hypothetical protein ACYC4R_06885 [Anaerolineae bacterium]